MKRIIQYFTPEKELEYFEKRKTNAFVFLGIYGAIIALLLAIHNIIFSDDNYLLSISIPLVLVFFILINLFILRKTNISITGNIFSVGFVVLMAITINIIVKDVSILYKFTGDFYLIIGVYSVSVLLASKKFIIINAIIILLSTARVYFYALNNGIEPSTILKSAYIDHTVSLVIVFLMYYFTNKFTKNAIAKSNQEIEAGKLKNMELQASEKEIRASNEELTATTDALVSANDELLVAKGKAEESNKLKTEFLNNMSHEVRTPMNGIIGFSQLLEIPDMDDNTRKNYIDIIQKSSNQLLGIIDNIIEISKLGTKQVDLFERETDLNKLLSELYAVFNIKAQESGINLVFNKCLADEYSIIIIDNIKLYKILSNLLENAIKFTNNGIVEFGYSVKNIKQPMTVDKKAIQFYVKDTGIGINKEKQDIIFEKFLQADPELSRQYGGLGLGLAIVKENTELMGGEIGLDSEDGKGSTFYITLPYKIKM